MDLISQRSTPIAVPPCSHRRANTVGFLLALTISFSLIFSPILQAYAQQRFGEFSRADLNQATFNSTGKYLNDMRYGCDGVCTAFAYNAQRGFEQMGVDSRIVWAHTTSGYHAFNEVNVNGQWVPYEPQNLDGQMFATYGPKNVTHIFNTADGAPIPQGGQNTFGGAGGNSEEMMQQMMLVMLIMQLFQQMRQAQKNNKLQGDQRERFNGASNNLLRGL